MYAKPGIGSRPRSRGIPDRGAAPQAAGQSSQVSLIPRPELGPTVGRMPEFKAADTGLRTCR